MKTYTPGLVRNDFRILLEVSGQNELTNDLRLYILAIFEVCTDLTNKQNIIGVFVECVDFEDLVTTLHNTIPGVSSTSDYGFKQ